MHQKLGKLKTADPLESQCIIRTLVWMHSELKIYFQMATQNLVIALHHARHLATACNVR